MPPLDPPQSISDILLQLQQDSPVLLALFDPDDVLRHANAAYRQAFVLEPQACATWTEQVWHAHRAGLGPLIPSGDVHTWLDQAQAARRQQAYRAFELELVDGRRLWMTETLDARGWLLCVASDLRGLRLPTAGPGRRAEDALTDQAAADPQQTRQALARLLAQDEAWPLCVAVLALDDDAPGSPAVDAGPALEARRLSFGRQLQDCIRREDACGPLDAQQHLLVLANAGPGQARAVLERLLTRMRYALAHAPAPLGGASCSAGLAQARWGEDADCTVQRAADLLRRAQAEGGNRLAVEDEA